MRSVLRWGGGGGVLGAHGEHRRKARHHTAQASSMQIQSLTACSCGCHLWLQQWLLVERAQGEFPARRLSLGCGASRHPHVLSCKAERL